ncbi:MAG: ABC transporter substrate-binding protein [Burkholderiales bacterium]|nr:ABC transporter substrate-binding protein [Burkholderiales bacterium]
MRRFLSPFRRLLLLALLAASSTVVAQTAPLRIIVGFPAGATFDMVARLIGEQLREELGRPVIVENRPGAGGALANQHVKAAPADDSTLLLAPLTTLMMYPHSHPQLQYDPFKDFVPVVHVAKFPYALGVGTQVPANSFKQYQELIKKNPKFGLFGSAGVGSATHYYGLMAAKASNLEFTHVPYKGTAGVLVAVRGGELPAGFVPLADMAGLASTGHAKLLAIVAEQRNQRFPDVPTFKELGFNDIVTGGDYTIFAPAGTSQEFVTKISAAVRKILKRPALVERFQQAYLEPTGYDASVVARELRSGYDAWGVIIKSSGFRVDQ